MNKKLFLSIIFVFSSHFISNSQNIPSEKCHFDLVVPSCPENPVQKNGYFLLLNSQFNNPELYWNKSSWGDDKTNCFHGFMRQPANVTYPCIPINSSTDNGIGESSQEYKCKAQLWNTNVPDEFCDYSMAEIKTMSTKDPNFKSYYFYGSGYFEAKVKLFARQGQGSAMWLWGLVDKDDLGITYPNLFDNMEIDVFETYQNSTDIFNITYHWRKTTLPLDPVFETHTIHLQNYDYTNSWTVFAVEWNEQFIKWYVNNELVDELWMSEPAGWCASGDPKPTTYYPPLAPFCLRFNTGNNTTGNTDPVEPWTMPVKMEIEYVRVYKKNGEKASPIKIFSGIKNQICASANSPESSNTVLSANYYPDAVYTWSSPAFEFQPFEKEGHLIEHHNGKVKMWVKPNVTGNQIYPIVLHTTILNHSEYDTIYYYLSTSEPPMPPNYFQAHHINGSGCLYELDNPIYTASTLSCEYFDDQTGSWTEATIKTVSGQRYAYFGKYDPNTYVSIQYREKNTCGYSPVRYSSLTTPPPPTNPPCGW